MQHEETMAEFMRNHSGLLEDYTSLLEVFLIRSSHLLTSIDIRRVENTMRILKMKGSLPSSLRNLNDLSSVLRITNNVIARAGREFRDQDDGQLDNFSLSFETTHISENLRMLYHHIDSNIKQEMYSKHNSTYEKTVELNKQTKRIMDQLEKSKTLFVSTEIEKEFSIVMDKISSIIKNINRSIISHNWSSSEHEKHNNIYLKDIASVLNKVDFFNEIIEKYESLSIELKDEGMIQFRKQNSDIEFNSLSSGEKRLCIIFLNLIFVDVNIYLIDEPEMSLSINYQSKIVDDMMRITQGKTLMIATHAPYIFQDFSDYFGNTTVEVK